MSFENPAVDNNNTALQEAQELIRKSREEYRKLIEETPDLITRVDLEGRYLFVNHSSVEILGLPPKDCLGKVAFDFIHPDDREKTSAEFQNWLKGSATTFSHENRIVAIDGPTHHMNWTIRPERDQFGNITGFASTARDITARKKSEEDLKKSEQLFRDFFASNPIATIITSPSGRIHMINSAFSEGSGFSAAEVIGKTSQEVGFWRDLASRDRMVAAIREHGFINNLETRFYGKNGEPMTCLVCARAIEHENEVRILSTVIDVTIQRQAEEALRKLEQTKSAFISTAAHELRTPLIAVLGYAELLENASQFNVSEEQKQAYPSIIIKNAEILKRLVDDLMDVEQVQLERPLSLRQEKISIAKLINEATESLAPKCPDHRLILTHANSLPKVIWGDSGRITQVMNNLIDNAVKYSPEGGIIEIATATEKGLVKISIKDQGVGMARTEVEQLFHRFYRAKPMDTGPRGLGLGMFIVKQIVEEHGGEIDVTSHLGKGTTVTVTLPIKMSPSMETKNSLP